jgi:predicted metal-binding membrane protein
LRQVAEDGCHWAPRLRVFGVAAWRDSLVYGFSHGGWCVLACWPLMLAPLTAGVAELGVMVACAAIMVVNRHLPRSDPMRIARRRRWSLQQPAIARTAQWARLVFRDSA